MTDRDRLSAALTSVHWSPRELAEVLDIRADTVRKWLAERAAIPPSILPWLETLAAFHDAHPRPPRDAALGSSDIE
jgi:hypothetical protein